MTEQREKAETDSSLKVAHAAGETRVPAQADRVVALSPDSLDTSLALGVKPVGVATFDDKHVPAYLAAARARRGAHRHVRASPG